MKLLPLDAMEDGQTPDDFGTVPKFRVRVIPVLGTTPALFGMAVAARVLCALAGCGTKLMPQPVPPIGNKLQNKMTQRLVERERRQFGAAGRAAAVQCVDEALVGHLVATVWRCRCAVTGMRMGGGRRLILARWRAARPISPQNLVLLLEIEADRLRDAGSPENAGFPLECVTRIDTTLSTVAVNWWDGPV